MLTEKQFNIFKVFARRPFAEYSRKSIKQESKEKSNNTLALTINTLKKEGVLIERIIGRTGLLTLNHNNSRTALYIALCNTKRIEKSVALSIQQLKNELEAVTPFYSLVIFGSYATGKQTQKSDVDIAIFFDGDERRKNIIASLNSAKLKAPLDIDAHAISRTEMVEMLTNNEENLGKQIARKHVAVHNHQIFYDIVQEGMKHGFRI